MIRHLPQAAAVQPHFENLRRGLVAPQQEHVIAAERIPRRRPMGLAGVTEHDAVGIPPQVDAVDVAGAQPPVEHVADRIARMQAGLHADVAARLVAPGILRAGDVGKGPRVALDESHLAEVHGRIRQHDRPRRVARGQPDAAMTGQIVRCLGDTGRQLVAQRLQPVQLRSQRGHRLRGQPSQLGVGQ